MGSLFKMPIESLRGVGAARARLFGKLGVKSVGELIRFYPRTYEDWSDPCPISEAQNRDVCCIRASIDRVLPPARIRGGMTLYKIIAYDDSGTITITFFNQKYVYEKLRGGGEYLFYGTVRAAGFFYEMSSPTVSTVDKARIHPVYPQTAGLSTKQIEDAVRQALALLPEKMKDPIPGDIREKFGLCSLDRAIREIHFPGDMQSLERARNRLAFEELLVLQLGLARLKGGRQEFTSHRITRDCSGEFISRLPYRLTNAQSRAIDECIRDMMTSGSPMNRLIQGDVGSGKTAVAAAVCYTAVKNGLQCAFMVPTEILARQHFQALSLLLEDTGVRLELLTGSVSPAGKKKIKEQLESGETDLVIGTHALISDNVRFSRLGLVITDEQHRFGVSQRSALISKGESPHIMVMSATPIPRTLALMVFGDLDLSVLDELPPGRQKVDTYLIDSAKRLRAFGFLKKQILKGNQCYIVCPLVEQSEMSELQSAEEYIEKLKKTPLGECRTGLLHGRMKADQKEEVMRSFSEGEIDLLVSTTVIEVGVNVPNATVMMIENAERFGLSQLHQLRGRVGRGSDKAYCILVSDNQGDTTRQRLSVMCRTNDGFRIADEDLRLRGPGDFFGSRQSGLPEMKIVGMSGMEMLEDTQEAAREILEKDPQLSDPEHRSLRGEVGRLFARTGGAQLQ